MNDRNWFILWMRAIGVLVLAFTVPDIGTLCFWLYERLSTGVVFNSYATGGFVVTTILRIMVGFYLLRGGGWIVQLCSRDLAGHCRVCGYVLDNVPGEACPECGTKFRVLPAPMDKPASNG